MSARNASPTEIVRRGFLKIDPATVLAAVDSLDLRGHGKVSAVVGIPLRTLQQRRDVEAFATSAPLAALKGLLELLAMSPLEKVVEALGSHSDSPSFDQLSAALETVRADGVGNDDVVALLTFAIVEEFPAAGHCRRLLIEREEFQLPERPDAATSASLLVPKETDPQVKEQRRARREAEKQRKKGPSSVRPTRPVKAKRPVPERAPTPRDVDLVPLPVVVRRPISLTPAELERFSPDHPLAGSVVLAEIPFDALDPLVPEQKSKERPALVVAASADAVLVRGIFSNPLATRHVFQAWRRIGLDHVCYLDDERVVVTGSSESLTRLGQLTDQEWNAQL